MIYAGKEDEGVGPADLSRTVAEMLELLKVSVSKRAELVTDLRHGLPPLRANIAQIQRIVLNLVTNASQAIGDGSGVIHLATRCVAAAGASVVENTAAPGTYLELEVSDNGCGMSQEMPAKVFDPFFTTRSAGHGLGLAVVQGIVRSLGGRIDLTSQPGKGSTFRVLLPSASTTIDEATRGAAGAPRPTLAATVLVVEDEDVLRQAVAKMLRRTGAAVFEAANGSVAIDLLHDLGDRIDLVLLDVTIPGPSSQQVLATAMQAKPDLKVILTSAYGKEEVAASMSVPIVRGFIRKPFRSGDLIKALQECLSG
jgi:CheY-like chemotaxis protein